MSTYLERVDLPFYQRYLDGFLPERIIDVHTHAGRMAQVDRAIAPPAFWADRICAAMPMESLATIHATIFPGKQVRAVSFAFPRRNVLLDEANAYIGRMAREQGGWGLLVTKPSWSAEQVLERVQAGGHRGLKPYFYLVDHVPQDKVTILDCLPHHHLRLANERGWVVMLHIPRPGRLADASNIAQIKQISVTYPNIKLIIAHIGRAYCPRYAIEGFAELRGCKNLLYDFSANCSQPVMEMLINEVGPQRILFGTDLPIVLLRMRRECEGDRYVNYVRRTRFIDAQTRRDPVNEDTFTFLVYEQIAAFRRAAENAGLSRDDIKDVFCGNAERLLA